MQLNELEFVDLYLTVDKGPDGKPVERQFLKGLKTSTRVLSPVPEACLEEARGMRKLCTTTLLTEKNQEFYVNNGGVKYRVRAEKNIWNQWKFTLRKLTLSAKRIEDLGFHDELVRQLLRQDLKGLVLIAGETGAGKTSTAAALLQSRLVRHGGLAVAIEDPPEINMHGPVGDGWCEQVPARRDRGGYKEHLVGALRDNPDMILLGEVRDEATATEVVNASCNGHMIISTLHAQSVEAAIERLSGLASSGSGLGTAPTNAKLAMGLQAVIWQHLVRRADGQGYTLEWQALNLQGDQNNGARVRVREGKFSHLAQDINQQAIRMGLVG
ncbi:twitching motility protein PilT [Pusillimonas sp. T2]|uniref:ATPase, T2SS/T4P/T4SS family n=1 Tax=Pusillimonas sp. T2 TaxID=1548123 RepID=UPI000B8B2040|nr:ATPase, T2SS/T4P/T4SS family [Pusillimonas sp. T2]OXR48028.1 twitching motility protein PilT [Pusillimonas sp. T2]